MLRKDADPSSHTRHERVCEEGSSSLEDFVKCRELVRASSKTNPTQYSTSEPVLKSEFSFLDLATTHTTLTSAQRVLTKPQLGKIRPKYFVVLNDTVLRRYAFRHQPVPTRQYFTN